MCIITHLLALMDRIENEMIYMYSGNEPKRGKGVPPGGGGAVMPG